MSRVPPWPPMSYKTRCWTKEDVERFWEKVLWLRVDGCWLWTGGKNEKGYGIVSNTSNRKNFNKRSMRAHHFSWVLANGPTIGDLHVLHSCDNPPCVNPLHLFLGTNKDNVVDAMSKGRRTQVGERNGGAKLKESDVIEILERLAGGETQAVIADDYGVSKEAVRKIKSGRYWKNVTRGRGCRPKS